MEEKVNGIVLGGTSYGENDKIINIFTVEQGVVCAKIKGVKKAGAKMKFVAEPFCFAEIILAKTGKMRTVIGASLIDSFYPLRENIKKYYCGAVLLEYVKKFLKEGLISQPLFILTANTLKSIAYGNGDSLGYLICFLLRALALSGYSLSIKGCFVCEKEINGKVFFDYVCGGFFCENCANESCKEINPNTYLLLKRANSGEILTEEQSVKPLRLLNYYLDNGAEVNVKSLKELLSLFAD